VLLVLIENERTRIGRLSQPGKQSGEASAAGSNQAWVFPSVQPGNTMASNPVEDAKKKAAFAVVDDYVRSGMVLGIGSGSTIIYVVERLSQRVKHEGLQLKACVPSSFQALALIESAGLPLSTIQTPPELDLAIDGMDEADEHLNLIKGGGGCMLQEKIVAAAAKQFMVVADYRKDSTKLGQQWKQGVPLEVLPLSYRFVLRRLQEVALFLCALHSCVFCAAWGPV
jgi:ribose 5-phosphate isomerase